MNSGWNLKGLSVTNHMNEYIGLHLRLQCGIFIRQESLQGATDRRAPDDIILDILGLAQVERDEVYWAVCELVKNRLEKARSV